MNNYSPFHLIIITIIVVVFQLFIPEFYFQGMKIIPDILIIFLTYVGYKSGRVPAITLGFILGLMQDFITQVELLGVLAFAKSAVGFGMGSLTLYQTIWSKKLRLIFIFSIYLLHFFIFYFIQLNGTPVPILYYFQIIFIQSLICYSLLWIVDKIVMNNLLTS